MMLIDHQLSFIDVFVLSIGSSTSKVEVKCNFFSKTCSVRHLIYFTISFYFKCLYWHRSFIIQCTLFALCIYHNRAACSEAVSLLYSSTEEGSKKKFFAVSFGAVAMPSLLSICQCFSTHSSSTLAATSDGSAHDDSCLKALFEL